MRNTIKTYKFEVTVMTYTANKNDKDVEEYVLPGVHSPAAMMSSLMEDNNDTFPPYFNYVGIAYKQVEGRVSREELFSALWDADLLSTADDQQTTIEEA